MRLVVYAIEVNQRMGEQDRYPFESFESVQMVYQRGLAVQTAVGSRPRNSASAT